MAEEVVHLRVSSEEAYFKALETIEEASRPIGAWKLRRLLQKRGLVLSKATAGRLLKSMEDNGHARTEGHVGRVISARGRSALHEWLKAEARKKSHTAFEESLAIRGRKHLLDALIARRAIESETASLAAQKATGQDLLRLERIIEEHQRLLDSGLSGADKDAEFHRVLAEAGRNRVLASALEVIHHNPQIGRVLEYIRSKMGSKMVEDHKKILVQIAARDEAGAREAMMQHIAGVIKDVDTYWSEIVRP